MAKRDKNAESASVETPKPATDSASMEAPQAAAAPTFTISADSRFGRRIMFWAAQEVRYSLMDEKERAAIIAKAREFDLYEEAIRTGKQ